MGQKAAQTSWTLEPEDSTSYLHKAKMFVAARSINLAKRFQAPTCINTSITVLELSYAATITSTTPRQQLRHRYLKGRTSTSDRPFHVGTLDLFFCTVLRPRQSPRPHAGSGHCSATGASHQGFTPSLYCITSTQMAGDVAPFFAVMPRELRDEIYDNLWRDLPAFHAGFMSGGIRHLFHIVYEDGSSNVPDYPSSIADKQAPWFLANRQLMQEAMDQFYRNSTWVYMDKSAHISNDAIAWFPTRPARFKSTLPRLSIEYATRIGLSLLNNQMFGYREINGGGKPIACIQFKPKTLPNIRGLSTSMLHSPNLTNLSMFLKVNSSPREWSSLPPGLELKYLQDIYAPKLRKLMFYVGIPEQERTHVNVDRVTAFVYGLKELVLSLFDRNDMEVNTELQIIQEEWIAFRVTFELN